MWETVTQFLRDFWSVLAEMSPYLLLGFAAAGVLNVLISRRLVERHLGGEGFLASLKAAAFGVPMPLCSCGVIPVSAELRRSGSGKGPTLSFLIATPQTGVDSILVTWSLMGGFFAVVRPVVSLLTGLIGGSVTSLLTRRNRPAQDACCGSGQGHAEDHVHNGACPADNDSNDTCCSGEAPHEHDHAPDVGAPPQPSRLLQAVHHGFVELPQDIGKALLIGVLLSAAITTFTPDDFFQTVLGGGIVAMLAMAALGVPMYVCATASVPVAAALIARGASPGAALVFLMTGPATNAATVATLWKVMGKWTAGIYLVTIFGCAILAGLGVDALVTHTALTSQVEAMAMQPAVWQHVAAGLMLAILGWSLISPRLKSSKIDPHQTNDESTIVLAIRGMTCHHCVSAIERALRSLPYVRNATVDLDEGRAVVRGESLERKSLVKAVTSLGYSVPEASSGSAG
jgi:uncharacterized protein